MHGKPVVDDGCDNQGHKELKQGLKQLEQRSEHALLCIFSQIRKQMTHTLLSCPAAEAHISVTGEN